MFLCINAFAADQIEIPQNHILSENSKPVELLQQQKVLIEQYLGEDLEALSDHEIQILTGVIFAFSYTLVNNLAEKKKRGLKLSFDSFELALKEIGTIYYAPNLRRLSISLCYIAGITAIANLFFMIYFARVTEKTLKTFVLK